MKVQRFYRPEDISADLGYRAGFWDIYASSEQAEVDVDNVRALCQVRRSGSLTGGHSTAAQACSISSPLKGDGAAYATSQQEGVGVNDAQTLCQVRRSGALTDAAPMGMNAMPCQDS